MSALSSRGPRPLARFFGQFPHFTYSPQNHASTEISRLRRSGLWDAVYDDDDEVMDAYRDALTLEFNARYGTDANNLAAWQALCARIGIYSVPDTLEECREEVTSSHVNLIDLMHVHGTKRTVTRYASVYELSEYTIRTRKYFPKENAYAGNLLKYLLRHILNPEKNDQHRNYNGGRNGGKKRRGGKKAAK